MATWIPELGMELTFDEVRVPVSVWENGKVSADGTRLTLETVLYAISEANPPERIVEMFPGTKLPDLYLIAGYYRTRGKEAREYMRKLDEEWEQAKAEIDAQPGQQELRDRIKARARKMGITE